MNSKGTFAYRTYQHETYVKMHDGMEIAAGDSFDWVYRNKGIGGNRVIGIILQEKQVVWVDIDINRQEINKDIPNVYGTVDELTPGEYKIVLVSGKKLLDQISFRVYQTLSDE